MGRTQRHRNRKNRLWIDEESHNSVIRMLKWMRLKNSHFKVVNFENSGRGVYSKNDIEAGEELVAIPLNCMITIGDVKHSDIHELFVDFSDMPQVTLALFLIYEKHISQSSRYFSYINVLPKSYDTLLTGSDFELKALPCWIRDLVGDMVKEVAGRFENIEAAFQEASCPHCGMKLLTFFTYEEFLWAWCTINTRGVYFKDDDHIEQPGCCLALAPFLDLFNHSNDAEVEVQLDHQRGVYALKTNKPYKKFDQIFIKYGAHSNLRLLLEYGFILDDLSQDVVEFSFQEILNAVRKVNARFGEITKAKYKFIRTNSLNVNLNKSLDEFSWNVNGLLYILITQDSDLVQLLSKTYSSTWSDKEESIMEEIKVILRRQKALELANQLQVMNNVQEPSLVFTVATDLVRKYIRIVER